MFPGWDKVTPPVRCYMKLCDCRRAAPPVRRVCIGLFHARKMFRHIKAQSVKSSKLVVKSIWNPANVLVFQGFFGIIKIFVIKKQAWWSIAQIRLKILVWAIFLFREKGKIKVIGDSQMIELQDSIKNMESWIHWLSGRGKKAAMRSFQGTEGNMQRSDWGIRKFLMQWRQLSVCHHFRRKSGSRN